MSSFRPDPTFGRRSFVPASPFGASPPAPSFAATSTAPAAAAESIEAPPAEPGAPEPSPEVWTAEQVEALEAEAFERGVASEKKAQDALERACAALEASAAGLRGAAVARITAQREAMLDLSSEIASAWVGSKLALDRTLLGDVLDRALESCESATPERLFLSTADRTALVESAEERIEGWRERYGLDLVEDASLAQGDFRIEARQGAVDGRRARVLERLREALAEALTEPTEVEAE